MCVYVLVLPLVDFIIQGKSLLGVAFSFSQALTILETVQNVEDIAPAQDVWNQGTYIHFN
jgi:hypothetical protein